MERAGLHCLAAIDFNKEAIVAFQHNFPDVSQALQKDLIQFSPAHLKKLIGTDHVDTIVGGPPCQGIQHGPASGWSKSWEAPERKTPAVNYSSATLFRHVVVRKCDADIFPALAVSGEIIARCPPMSTADIDGIYLSNIERGARNLGILSVVRIARTLKKTASGELEGVAS